MSNSPNIEIIDISRILLDRENPRHDSLESDQKVIETLCKSEKIANLAKDIANNGLSPVGAFCVMKLDPTDPQSMYVAKDGNRRLCALKLLTDPELAPTSNRKMYETLAEKWTPITQVRCWVSDNQNDIKHWLKRIHGGEENGIGQRTWSARQKARHSGTESKEHLALEFLEWGVARSLIAEEESNRKITTVSRFIANSILRKALGLDVGDNNELTTFKEDGELDLLAKKFFSDLVQPQPKVNSRANTSDIERYAREELDRIAGLTTKTVNSRPLSKITRAKQKKNPTTPQRKSPLLRIKPSEEIINALNELDNQKLKSLYNSICTVPLKDNVPLLTVGVWSLLESLASLSGRTDGASFVTYLTGKFMKDWGAADKEEKKELANVLKRIHREGNSTKHHKISANFNDKQLANDLKVIEKLILHCVQKASSK